MGIIALFGGTFNPIHNGHREIIEEICNIDGVEKVIVIPTKIPPHKSVDFLASETDRIEMCRLATSDLRKVELSDLELKRVGKSYTIDTLNDILKLYPHNDIAITIGADMVVTFDEWKNYKEIISKAKLITFSRTTTDFNEYKSGLEFLRELNADLIEVDKQILDISSSYVRELLLSNSDVSHLIPNNVYSYIKDKNIYGVANYDRKV
jgi:nicotinate-nucleotide adenylyltransferase